MGENTKIEWCRHTFNPWYGCQKVAPACDFCYAESWAKRSGLVEWGPHASRRRSSVAKWREPLKWDAAAKAAGEKHTVFSCSLGDIFDNQIETAWRRDFFQLCRETPNLIYLLLTKRPQNIIKLCVEAGGLPRNAAIGTTVEDQIRADVNVPALLEAKIAVRPLFTFVSCEPLLGHLSLEPWLEWPDHAPEVEGRTWGCAGCDGDCQNCPAKGAVYSTEEGDLDDDGCPAWITHERQTIDWIICGGESGPNARPMHPDWARSLRDQALASGAAYLFKQWGANIPDDERAGRYRRVPKSVAGRTLDGREWTEFPEAAA